MLHAMKVDRSCGELAGYIDRCISPAETVRRLQPHFAALGITRVARQTGLDRIGIPCFAAFRPNATTLSNSQGKGIDDDAARASAVMEAAEFAIAEKPDLPEIRTTIAALRGRGRTIFDANRLMPMGEAIPVDQALPFVAGFNLFRGEEVIVPYDAVTITTDPTRLSKLTRSTNGLASGNTQQEAILHALCELIERDATTLSRIDPARSPLFAAAAFGDREVDRLIGLIENAGFELWLVEETSDLGVPCFRAVIGDPTQGYRRHFDLSVGYGCHPASARAAIRAITEAAQTRVTNIAGSRDDFMPAEFEQGANTKALADLRARPTTRELRADGCAIGTPLDELTAFVTDQLWRHRIEDVTVVPVGGEAFGISVVKVLTAQLEDRIANKNWRPGKRALKLLLAAA